MTGYLAPLDQRFAAQYGELLQRVKTIEAQIAAGAGAFAAFVCTSTTRPASPNAGQEIYETDTTRLLVWSGTAWEQKAFATLVCTSSTRPAAPFQGMQIFETDTGNTSIWSGAAWETAVHEGAWTSYTPTFNGTLGNGTVAGSYFKVGRSATVRVQFQMGSTTTISGTMTFTLPFTAATPPGGFAGPAWLGSAWAQVAVLNDRAGVAVVFAATATVQAAGDNIPNNWTATSPQTWAVNDNFVFQVTYGTTS